MDTDHDKIHTKMHMFLNANTKLKKTKKYLTPITSKRKKRKKTKNNFLPDYTWILTFWDNIHEIRYLICNNVGTLNIN